MNKLLRSFVIVTLAVGAGRLLAGDDIAFRHHYISRDLPTTATGIGDYGLTALVDINRDGHLDFVVGGRSPKPERLYWFEYRGPDDWVRHDVGQDYRSDVGLAALDVDGDGWPDLVTSGVWYRNPGKATDQPWERFVFDDHARGAHDIVTGDIDGDGKLDVIMMSDATKELNGLYWYKIPADPKQPWEKHKIGPGIHGAIAPAGIGDINGDGHNDVVRGDTWFENKDGRGLEWVAHKNIPMGRRGPFGVCVRTVIADMDGNGKKVIVMCDADISDSKIYILRTPDKGQTWTKQALPQSFQYGSLHSLAVADFRGNGRLDIVSNEQEELLPAGRTNPRFVVWENLGDQKYAEHIILDEKLGGHELQVGDVKGDGVIDICSKAWGVQPWNGNGGKMHVDYLENVLHDKKAGAASKPSGPGKP
ncbi:MAG TPA: VCBS repeat-containing protein [Tepidisphaeraceae bacterium]|nr:VCBS repeat-containing protein [Tepidisphaeraceae bacterium]